MVRCDRCKYRRGRSWRLTFLAPFPAQRVEAGQGGGEEARSWDGVAVESVETTCVSSGDSLFTDTGMSLEGLQVEVSGWPPSSPRHYFLNQEFQSYKVYARDEIGTHKNLAFWRHFDGLWESWDRIAEGNKSLWLRSKDQIWDSRNTSVNR